MRVNNMKVYSKGYNNLNTRCIDTWGVTQIKDELQIAYGSDANFLQYGALHLTDSYFRLNYGCHSGWGTSVILLPAFWSGGYYFHGAPINVTWKVVAPNLILSAIGNIAELTVSLTITLIPPQDHTICAQVQSKVKGWVKLDDKPSEAFKVVMLSSMHVAPTLWDAQAAYVGNQCLPIPSSRWLVPPQPPTYAHTFGLYGGTSDWKTNAPTISITLEQLMRISGWVTPSSDPNDDNVGLWAASDVVLDSWYYQIVATAADEEPSSASGK